MGSTMAQKIAMPPPRGLGFAWILRPPGLSTNPTRTATRLTTHVNTQERTKEKTHRRRIGPIIQWHILPAKKRDPKKGLFPSSYPVGMAAEQRRLRQLRLEELDLLLQFLQLPVEHAL